MVQGAKESDTSTKREREKIKGEEREEKKETEYILATNFLAQKPRSSKKPI